MMQLEFKKTGVKWDRLSAIYDRLLRSDTGVTIKELSEELGVSTKTIQRDLHESLSGSGVYCEGRNWKVTKNMRDDGLGSVERIILGVLDGLAKNAGHTFYSKAHRLLEQVSCQLEHPLFTKLDVESLDESHLALFSKIEDAIKSRNIISIDYTSVTKKKQTMGVKPIKLAFFDGFWYLIALDINDNDVVKKLYMKNIANVIISENSFTYPSAIAQKINSAHSVWFDVANEFTVRLYIEKEVAPYFERNPLATQTIEGRDPDGGIEIVLKMSHEMEILPLVQWYLPHVKIMEPQWLNEKLVEKIKAY